MCEHHDWSKAPGCLCHPGVHTLQLFSRRPIARTNLTSGVDKPRDFVWSLGCIGKATLSEASSKRSIVRPYQVPKKTEQRNGQASNTTNRLVLWSSAKASSWEVLWFQSRVGLSPLWWWNTEACSLGVKRLVYPPGSHQETVGILRKTFRWGWGPGLPKWRAGPRGVALPLPLVGSGTEPGQKPRRRVAWRERTPHVGGGAAGPGGFSRLK